MKSKKIFSLMSAGAGVLALTCGVGAATAAAQSASTSYKPTRRDPFVKPKPVVVKLKVEKKAPGVVEAPPIKARIEAYKQMKQRAMMAQSPAPKPTTALLLKEVQVVGIFRTPRGYAAMVEATPIKLSYTIYPGESFYDGQLVAIEENRLTFRRETRFVDGHREMAVEVKPLRQPSTADQLTTDGSSAPAAATKPATEAAAAPINEVPKGAAAVTAAAVVTNQQ
ncbi:MAG: hypothetical protein ACRD9R_13825 [Pyrinomonadaceae bacterium]